MFWPGRSRVHHLAGSTVVPEIVKVLGRERVGVSA